MKEKTPTWPMVKAVVHCDVPLALSELLERSCGGLKRKAVEVLTKHLEGTLPALETKLEAEEKEREAEEEEARLNDVPTERLFEILRKRGALEEERRERKPP